jgi:hypothetical protein
MVIPTFAQLLSSIVYSLDDSKNMVLHLHRYFLKSLFMHTLIIRTTLEIKLRTVSIAKDLKKDLVRSILQVDLVGKE